MSLQSTIYAESTGYVGELRTKVTYANMRSGVGNTSGTVFATPDLKAHGSSNNYYVQFYRGYFIFDTSSLAGHTITACELHVYCSGVSTGLGAPDYNITTFSPADPDNIATTDFDSFSDTTLCDTAWTPSAGNWHTYTFNSSGISALNTSGHTSLMIRDSWDLANSFGGTFVKGAETSATFYGVGLGNNAYLVVTYSGDQISKDLKYCVPGTFKITQDLKYNIAHSLTKSLSYSISNSHLIQLASTVTESFTTVGVTTWSPPWPLDHVDYLVVGGGGTGGGSVGGGGGGGGFREGTLHAPTSGAHTVVVGGSSQDSQFNVFKSLAGGAGGTGAAVGSNGGSGGGGGGGSGIQNGGTAVDQAYGKDGGYGYGYAFGRGGGGGGATEAGSCGSYYGCSGNGGTGRQSTIFGGWYSGGGGGGYKYNSSPGGQPGAGGTGGGGGGGYGTTGTPGSANTGGGGGGSGDWTAETPAGGSGIVKLLYHNSITLKYNIRRSTTITPSLKYVISPVLMKVLKYTISAARLVRGGPEVTESLTSVSTTVWNPPGALSYVKYLVVGGGGDGGNTDYGGGGGGGQVIEGILYNVSSPQTVRIAGFREFGSGQDGDYSQFGSVVANGGKHGNNSGGSGGNSASGKTGGSGITNTKGGGGGGDSANGASPSGNYGGAGGSGTLSTLTGLYYGGGGGGGSNVAGYPGPGGQGGGGAGGAGYNNPMASQGGYNTGGGTGGNGQGAISGGIGPSQANGVVVLKYPGLLELKYTVNPPGVYTYHVYKNLKCYIYSTHVAITKSLKYYITRVPSTIVTKQLKYYVKTTHLGTKDLNLYIRREPTKSYSLGFVTNPHRVLKTVVYVVQPNPIKKILTYIVVRGQTKKTKDLTYSIRTITSKSIVKIVSYSVNPLASPRKLKTLRYTIPTTLKAGTLPMKCCISATKPSIQKNVSYNMIKMITKSLKYCIQSTHLTRALGYTQTDPISFTSTGTITWTAPEYCTAIQYLVVGGGGSGGVRHGGGGGGGGVRTGTLAVGSLAPCTITVGAGGTATSTSGGHGNTGGYSRFGLSGGTENVTLFTGAGGGGGGCYSGVGSVNGSDGGSGGGAGDNPGSGTGGSSSPVTSPVQGYAGGNATYPTGGNQGAGGGGAGGAGAPNTTTSNGGIGIYSDISGSSVGYAGGGGGGRDGAPQGGATEGGGAGAYNYQNAGTDGKGGGGGGARDVCTSTAKGGDGIVILRCTVQRHALSYAIVQSGTKVIPKLVTYSVKLASSTTLTKTLYYVAHRVNVSAIVPSGPNYPPVNVAFPVTYMGAGAATLSWDFGDGSTEYTEAMISATVWHQYATTGTFSATVTAYYGLRSVSASTTFTIVPGDRVVMYFYGTPRTGYFPLEVQFQNVSMDLDGGSLSFHWYFGDGQESTEHSPKHIYVTPGTYSVTLYGFDRYGYGHVCFQQAFIYYEIPSLTADFEIDSGGTFDTGPGSYVVRLTVTDRAGNTSIRERNVMPLVNSYVKFRDTSTGDIVAWKWDYGTEEILIP